MLIKSSDSIGRGYQAATSKASFVKAMELHAISTVIYPISGAQLYFRDSTSFLPPPNSIRMNNKHLKQNQTEHHNIYYRLAKPLARTLHPEQVGLPTTIQAYIE
jgi:hypothetical protein